MIMNCVLLLIAVIGGCSTCSDHCLKCITPTFCTVCETGYKLKDRRCHGCSHPCMSYNSTNSCESCYSGYYLHHECCYPCISPCHECTFDSCNSCTSGYVIINGQCDPCSSGCLNCRYSEYLSCTLCKSEYYLNGSICNKCSNGCLKCTSSYCSSCKSGYYLSNGNCNQCSSPCRECTSSLNCSSCMSGYYLSNGHCNQCSRPCLECTSSSNCSSCMSGYYLSNGHCNQCSSPCLECSSSPLCMTCSSGHYLNGSQCVKCNIACLTCSDTTGDCTTCQPKFYLSHGTCVPCGTNCTSCNSSSGICDVCEDGYYGDYCNNTCRGRCNSSACEHISGKCIPSESHDGSMNHYTRIIDITMGAVGGTCAVAVYIGIVVAALYLWRRKTKEKTRAGNNSFSNVVADCQSSHARENEVIAEPQYSTPYKVKNMNNKKKSNATSQPDVSITYENATAAPGPQSNVAGYLDDELMEEINGPDSDSTGGRVEGKYETYYNTSRLFRRQVTVATLVEVVAKKSLSDYEEEFKKLPDGLTREYQEALKPENAMKNRYKKVYPYDATRVVLKDGGEGDYINASYIYGPTGHIGYIAALGPTVDHSEDFSLFWRMVWQENVDKIVVLTRLKEGKIMKFERYWPLEGKTKTYGPVRVRTVTEETFSEYTIRRFLVSLDSEPRTVFQAHYMAWPDRSVPDNLVSLLEFRHKVEALPTKRCGPLVVHCSAGIGRTGTYIALDLLIREGQSSGPPGAAKEPSVDVYGCVSALRGQRGYMVQNVEQYRYLHHTLVHALNVDTGPLPIDQIYTCLKNESKALLVHQFKMLQQVESLEEDNAAVANKKKVHKNSPGTNIRGDKHEPQVTYLGPHRNPDKINAIYLDGHVAKRKFLIAQTPLATNIYDFVRLVYQEHVYCIVSMDTDQLTDKDVGIYVPATKEELILGTFTVKCTKCEIQTNFILRKLEIHNRCGEGFSDTSVHHFQYTGWPPCAQVPASAESLVQTIMEVEKTAGQLHEPGPILVHCRTGAERSGLFCTVGILLEKAVKDQSLSVINTVSRVKNRHPLAIPFVDQYIFCHKCIAVSNHIAENSNVVGITYKN